MQKEAFLRSGVLLVFIVFFLWLLFLAIREPHTTTTTANGKAQPAIQTFESYPLSIAAMRNKSYPGSNFVIEETLDPGVNYKKFVVSYKSDGFKIYGLLTIPTGDTPKGGFPAIIFNHGYIPPDQYRTTERYVAYQDGFAREGYVTFKSDYRGNGDSEGAPQSSYFSPSYTTDVLNAVSSVKKLPYVNKNKIGMWGHSMGGNITQRVLVVSPKDIKAAVIWGGAVGSYEDLFKDWWDKRRPNSFTPSERERRAGQPSRQTLIKEYGDPSENSPFWSAISPTSYLSDINAPIQLDYGSEDEEVPPALSQALYHDLQNLGKTVEIYEYPGSDHNISQGFDLAMQRSVAFFDRYLK